MVRIYLVLFLLFITLGCHARSSKPMVFVDSQLNKNVDPYSWDFGTAREGTVLEHIFILRNETQKPLNIKDVNTSCGCAVSKVIKRALLPGEETSIEVKFNTKGYFGPTQQYVYIHTDNLNNPILRYVIKARVTK